MVVSEREVPSERSDLHRRSSSGSPGSNFLRPGGREWSELAPGGTYPQADLEIVASRSAPSGAKSDGLRFLHLQSIASTKKWKLALKLSGQELSTIQTPCCREYWQLILESNLTV